MQPYLKIKFFIPSRVGLLHPSALDQDLSKIAEYRQQSAIFMKGKKSGFDIKKLFVSAMLHIYTPGVFKQQTQTITITKYGFIRQLTPAIGVTEGRTSQIVRQVIVYEKIYEDYRNEVTGLVAFLTAAKAEAC